MNSQIAFETCGLCGAELEGALDVETGVCARCAKMGGHSE